MRWSDSITNLMDMSFKQTPGDSEGQRNLVCCSAWGHKELDTTEHTHTHTHTRAITSENLLEMQIFTYDSFIPSNPSSELRRYDF